MNRPAKLLILCIVAAAAWSCAPDHPTTRPASAEQRQKEALADPYGYSPFPQKDDNDKMDTHHDHDDRDGLKRDLENVFNP